MYSLFIKFFQIFFKLASFFSSKVQSRLSGLSNQIIPPKKKQRVWLHCASAGEYEQAIPIIEELAKYDNIEICVSFFSSSGVEYYDKQPRGSFRFYLPFDNIKCVKNLLSQLQPDYVIWIKYEFWKHFIQEINNQKIPIILLFTNLSGIAQKNFLERYRLKRLLPLFTHIYSITPNPYPLISAHLISDGKWEQALKNTDTPFENTVINKFNPGNKTILIGSAHLKDIKFLKLYLNRSESQRYNWIIVPHEIDKDSILKIEKVLYEELSQAKSSKQLASIQIINQLGILKYLYRYADIAWIGGGFDQSVHNVLEAAAYGKPIICGTRIQKVPEAIILEEKGILFPFNDVTSLCQRLQFLNGIDLKEFEMITREVFEEKLVHAVSNQIVSDLTKYLGTNHQLS